MAVDAERLATATIELASTQFERTDSAFLDQVVELLDDIADSDGIQVVRDQPSGTKGLAEIEPIIAVVMAGGPGMVALCSVAKLWIKQRGDRLLRITMKDPKGSVYVYEVDSNNFSEDAMLEAFSDVLKRQK